MVDTATMGKLLERFAQGVAAHDRENPDHNSWGIGMAHFDIERLGLEEGEEILPGITVQTDGGVSGNFRVLCDGDHDEELSAAEEEAIEGLEISRLVRKARPGCRDRHQHERDPGPEPEQEAAAAGDRHQPGGGPPHLRAGQLPAGLPAWPA